MTTSLALSILALILASISAGSATYSLVKAQQARASAKLRAANALRRLADYTEDTDNLMAELMREYEASLSMKDPKPGAKKELKQ
jgi:uncharacterized protein HemX